MLAQVPDAGEVFIREVDDEVRRERMAGLWSRWGRLLFVGIGLLLLASAALLWWRGEQVRRSDARGATFGEALTDLRQAEFARAAPKLDGLATAPEAGYRALAALAQAGVAAERGDRARALARYGVVAGDRRMAQPFRDLATLRAVQLEFDTLPPAQVIARLQPLAQPGNAWFPSSAELTALAYLKQNRSDLARPLFDAIIRDSSAPASLRGRAQQLVATLPPAAGPVRSVAR